MNILLEMMTLIVGIAMGIAVAWLLLNGVMTVAFRRPGEP
jgi:hypothetical protein